MRISDWSSDVCSSDLVAKLIQDAESILEYPMVDQYPLPTWTEGYLTLLGDAAHPMVPRGSNGAGQAILDARCLAGKLKTLGLTTNALQQYDKERVEATTRVVLPNTKNPPDALLRAVFEKSGDKPVEMLEDVLSTAEHEGKQK